MKLKFILLIIFLTSNISSAGNPIADDELILAVRSFPTKINDVMKALEKGADINQTDQGGNTALMYSVMYGISNPELVSLLLEKGARVNTKDKNGMTALMLASGHEAMIESVKLLLKAGADLNIKNNSGHTAMYYSLRAPETVNLLLKAGANDIRNPCEIIMDACKVAGFTRKENLPYGQETDKIGTRLFQDCYEPIVFEKKLIKNITVSSKTIQACKKEETEGDD